MLQKLQEYIDRHKLFSTSNKLLLAVSGGLDSVVMLDLLHRLGYQIEVAHMNFQLRGEESDGDEKFVKNLCDKLNIPVHIKRVDTSKHKEEEKISTQMAARSLRYDWFHELLNVRALDYLLTAHHADDSIETVLINILRGTGLSGLKGIVHNEMGIRPMLCFSREEIHNYARVNHLPWREDSSNSKEDYLRNKLRLNIMPQLDKIAHQWRSNVLKLSEDISISEKILENHFHAQLKNIFSNNRYQLSKIINSDDGKWLFRKSLLAFNFSHGMVDDILLNLDAQTGAIFSSNTHRLIKDRNVFILEELNGFASSEEIIVEHDLSIKNNTNHSLDIILLDKVYKPEKIIKNEIYLDFDKLEFPLVFRHWQAGDWFIPYGMKGKKKLSDFFIDEKFSIQQKENTFVLVSGSIIAAVMNSRVDDRYKITETTDRILKVTIK